MTKNRSKGLTLIDVVVGVALFTVIFLALIGFMRASLLLASLAKAKAGATAVANTQVEYIRSLPYDQAGTDGGIPAGVIPQYATTTMNGIDYGVRTYIEYADDPADGSGGADTNAITTDYKQIKVSVTYTLRGVVRTVSIASTYAPPSIETSTNGGTLRVVVVSASGAPISGASVRVVNASTSPDIDLTTFSDASGIVLLGGAPTSTEYQIYVSKAGYSSAQTYARDTTNQNPTPGYLTVVKNQTTTGTFAIDALGTLTLATYYPISATSTTDHFNNNSLIASSSNTQLSGGSLILADNGAGGYVSSGTIQSVLIAPSYISRWTTASTTLNTPDSTTVYVQVVSSSGALIPDAQLPGNSLGFTGSSIDLSGISTTTYPSLALKATLATPDSDDTSSINQWSINSLVGPIPVPNVSFTLTGAKVVGTTGGGAPIYKTTVATSTGASGSRVLPLEWDSYTLGISGYDAIDACSAPTYAISPATSYTHALYVGPSTTNSLLVSVKDSAGAYVSGATVTLSRTGFSQSVTTSACGTAYFGGVTSSSAYTVQISKTGYTTTSSTGVSVSGKTFYATSFP